MEQVTRTQAIARFLKGKTHEDLAALYSPDMEVQVNVAQDEGIRVEGEFKGRDWSGWTDHVTTWKPFRIPRNAKTAPEYEDVPIRFDLEKHVEGIGLTGWDWKNAVSKWVAFDFDAIVGHSKQHTKKLTDQELKDVGDSLSKVPWATIRKSTGGNGLHIYVTFATPIPTKTHTEHAALGRAVLGMLAAETGTDLEAKVDACGQNMWVWHRKMLGTPGLSLIKSGESLTSIPVNWRDHIDVINGSRKRVLPEFIKESVDGAEALFEELSGQRSRTPLDDEHKRLITFLSTLNYSCWFDADNHMLVTHTHALKKAHEELGLKGLYSTISPGSDTTHNCFAYPLRAGGWVVRRYTTGVAESSTWDQDRTGWTRCFFNKEPDLKTSASNFEGVEHPTGGYVFNAAEAAQRAAKELGVKVDLPAWIMIRQSKMKETKDNRVVIEIDALEGDRQDDMKGWLQEGKKWKRIFNVPKNDNLNEVEIGNYDDVVRHMIDANDADAGWVIKSDGMWHDEPIGNVTLFLSALGLSRDDTKTVLGSSVIKCWRLVNAPFEPEYPGNRMWNRKAPQFCFPPSQNTDELAYPTWSMLLNHIGQSLDIYVSEHPWAKTNGLRTGADYLKCWIASCFQSPTEPLPYLFLYGSQNTGKSSLHEALSLLVTKGIVRADHALSNSAFNGELEGAIVCVIEETDFSSKNKTVYNLMKDWVTARQLPISKKYETPYTITNTTHWMHCSNDISAVPIFPGDSRVTMCRVDPLDSELHIPKRLLLERLKKEGPDFLAAILNLEVPECNDRLAIPVLQTDDKKDVEESNRSPLELFMAEHCHEFPGHSMPFATFYDVFAAQLDGTDKQLWPKNKVGREINKQKFPRGKVAGRLEVHIANIAFKEPTAEELKAHPYVLTPGGKLIILGG